MLNLEVTPYQYEDAVVLLASWHRERGNIGFAAYSFPDPEKIAVRLVEVSDYFPAADSVRPIHFGRSTDFPFPSAVALLSSQDWERVLNGSLSLPMGWSLKGVQQVQFDNQE